MYQRFPSDRKEGARFRRPGAVAISVPSRVVLARQGNGSCGQGPLVCFRFRPLTKASFRRSRNQKQPVAFATSCRSLSCGESENRKPSTTPFVNPCRSAFYCVSLQTGSLTFEHFWAIFGPRFLTRRRHEDQEKCQFQTEGLRKE